MTKKKVNVAINWKRLFFIILSFNLISIGVIIFLIFGPVKNVTFPEVDRYMTEESSEFTVRTTKQNLNELINAYIDKLSEGSNHRYQVLLDEDVHLLGELPVFTTTVPLSIHLEPDVLDNGDLILKQKSITIGMLQLPNKKIMEYIKKYLPMPEWVIVNPKEEEIYVAISNMDIRSNFQVSIEQFNLIKNELSFKIKVPYKTLGIHSNN